MGREPEQTVEEEPVETEKVAPREARIKLIRQVESTRDSRVIVYVCSDRSGACAQIGGDVIRPMYEHVRNIGDTDRLDLFLYSTGGAVEVPWRIVSMLREYCKRLGVLIPYRAYSAATLLALGCDEIVMGKKAELSPIDPQLTISGDGGTGVQEQVSVEDVMSFFKFIKEIAGLTDQSAIANNMQLLTEKLSPWIVGSLYRTHTHIRMLAEKMLGLHQERVDEQTRTAIVESLVERIYSHGHGISRTEAKAIGLPVVKPDLNLESVLWSLLELYEEVLQLRDPIDPLTLLKDQDEYGMPVAIALIESRDITSAFRGKFRVRRQRKTPERLNININIGLELPPGLDPEALPPEIKNAIDQMVKDVQMNAPNLVQQQVRQQSPELKVESRIENGHWEDVTSEDF